MPIATFSKEHDVSGEFGAVLDSKFTEQAYCTTTVDYTDLRQLYRLAVLGGYIPGYKQQHFSIPLFARGKVKITRKEAPSTKMYTFSIPYSSKPIDQDDDDDDQDENPLNRPPEISVKTETSEIPGVKDREGKAYVNAAGDPITDPPVMLPTGRQVYTIVENLSHYDGDAAEAFQDAINENIVVLNSDNITKTFAAETAWVRNISATGMNENNVDFVQVTIEVAHEIRGWNALKNPLNAGYHFIDTDSTHKTILLEDGTEPKNQIPLDENGYPLTTFYQGSGWSFDATSDAVFLEFDHFKKKDLTALSSAFVAG